MILDPSMPRWPLAQVPANYTGVCYVIDLCNIEYYENGFAHRLDGPARITIDLKDNNEYTITLKEYFISGFFLWQHEFEASPIVIEHKLKRILEEEG